MRFGSDTVVGICGAAWGDEGKGKFTDEFAAEADVIVRAQGGCNAGHTVVVGSMTVKLHHVPSGIVHKGKQNIIGNGVVVDPRVLVEQEFAQLARQGVDVSGLRISGDAHLIMPWHRILDRAREWSLGSRKIGTTARGIGPAYADKALRCGLRLNDLHDCCSFKEAVAARAREKERIIFDVYKVPRDTFAEWMQAADQRAGAWAAGDGFNAAAIADAYCAWADTLLKHIADTRMLVRNALGAGKKMLLEGAQGLLLDIDHGTYPFVTSSSCGAGGFSTGAGVPPGAINRVYNIMSAYMTRVGSGPFPTELGREDQLSGEHADRRMPKAEAQALARSASDEYSLGKVIRHIAGEFGTTTGRPRRTGWFDAVACKMAVQLNGPEVFITKLVVLDALPKLKICTAYKYTGPSTGYYGRDLAAGTTLREFPTDARILAHCEPAEGEEYAGWLADTTGCGTYEDLPAAVRAYLAGMATHTGCRIRLVSIGPKRNQTLMAP